MGNRNSRPITILCPTAAAFLSPLGAREIFDAISANFGRLSPGGSLIVDLSNNLGDTKSLSCHPTTTTHRVLTPEARAAAGITEGLVRISVGLEHVDDLWRDLERAAQAAGSTLRQAA